MGFRTDSKASKKLRLQKETLRKLQLRILSDGELRGAAGGLSATCTLNHCEAPSHLGC